MKPQKSHELRFKFLTNLAQEYEKHNDTFYIIRCHLFIESILNSIIEETYFITEPDLKYFRFTHKVILATTIDYLALDSDLKGSLLYLNKLRNKCSHEIGYVVSEDDWNSLFASFRENYQLPYEKDFYKIEDISKLWIMYTGCILGILLPKIDFFDELKNRP